MNSIRGTNLVACCLILFADLRSQQPAPGRQMSPRPVVGEQIETAEGEPFTLRRPTTACEGWSGDREGPVFSPLATPINNSNRSHPPQPLSQVRWFGRRAPEPTDVDEACRERVRRIVAQCTRHCVDVTFDPRRTNAGQWGGSIGRFGNPPLEALEIRDESWTASNLDPGAGPRLISVGTHTPTKILGAFLQLVRSKPLRRPSAEPLPARQNHHPVGIFESHQDIGDVRHAGAVEHQAQDNTYRISASGENMWASRDAFHFAWKKMEGDLSFAADIAFIGEGKNPHRKACLMIRQSLDPDAPYVDIALHGDGLTSLQFREAKGGLTHEIQANLSKPTRLRLEKRGQYVRMYLASQNGEPAYSGAATRVEFNEPFLVGIGLCAHDADTVETAMFSNIALKSPLGPSSSPPTLHSTLETQSVASTDRRVVHVTPTRIEAPNWLPTGDALLYNTNGRIHRIPVGGGTPTTIDTAFAVRCNNDHGLSPDGAWLAISDQSQTDRKSRIYIVPVEGGTPKLITPSAPSYWHGWSPDGKTLAYCAERSREFDIYTIPVDGGDEKRLTNAPGLDDGPEFSPDGKFIYFNSDRSGRMQIWRMKPDGADQEQITDDEFNNWFPHPSPDGRRLLFLSYETSVTGHPENKDVALRILTLETKRITVIARLFGGQGTINVPCWSPDSQKIAFVSYQLVEK
jgi:hypothetical protein